MTLEQKKQVIILEHNGGRLANQLWNFMSIYAYALERGYECQNYSFFSYHQYFRFTIKSSLIRWLFFKPLFKGRNFFRRWYGTYVKAIKRRKKEQFIISTDENIYYLPPTVSETVELKKSEESTGKEIYFSGWLFRNPVGIARYYKELVNAFRPQKNIEEKVVAFMKEVRSSYRHIVGVHIRQGDYREFEGGKYLVSLERVREIMEEYLAKLGKRLEETCFIIASDEKIEMSQFGQLPVIASTGQMVEDLFMLSGCDVILGSNSTFGAWASYYGNIPLVVLQNETIDWEYYRDKDSYFENKYCTVVHY